MIIQEASKIGFDNFGSSGLDGSVKSAFNIFGSIRKKRKLSETFSELLESPKAESSTVDNWNLFGTSAPNHTVHNLAKRECGALANIVDRVKLWLMLSSNATTSNSSKKKDSSQPSNADDLRDEALSELHRAQDAAINMREAAQKYRLTRADLCSKIFQHPEIEDYQIALREYDEQDLFLSQQHLHDIMNIYMLLNDLLKPFLF